MTAATTTYAAYAPATEDARQACDDQVVTDLVACARRGSGPAWNALIELYAPLISSICRRHRLDRADAEDVSQSVWLCLVAQLDKIREPAALPGWLATTTRRECVRVVRVEHGPHAVIYALDEENTPDPRAEVAEQELLAAERQAALREAISIGPTRSRCLDRMRRYPAIAALIDADSGSPAPVMAAAC